MLKLTTYEKWLASMLKAEVVCAELLKGDLTFDKVKYTASGSFRKSFRTDVDTVTPTDNGIELSVNRDGLYDKMPEGLFHQTRGNSKSSVGDMVAEHKRYKAEEKNARKFFNPFEQEFFRYSLMVEQEERTLTGSMYGSVMQQSFRRLWDLEEQLPDEASAILTRMMPWAYKIKGDLQLTAKTLELALGKRISFEEIITEKNQQSENDFALGEGALGIDTLSGRSVSLPMVLWKFTIHDIATNEIEHYTNDSSYALFLKRFEDLFIPLDVDAVFDFDVKAATNEEITDAVLGYSLTI